MRRLLLVLLFPSLGLVTACSSSGSGSASGGNTALDKALGRIADTASTRAYVEFGRPHDAVELNGGTRTATGTYGSVIGYGASALTPYAGILTDKLGWDVLAADTAVTAGEPPHQGGLLIGTASKPDPAKLTSLGAKASGSTYRFRPDGSLNADDTLGAAVPSLFAINVMRVSGSDTRYAAAAAGLAQTDASSRTLADNPSALDVASCLANPLAAVLADRLPERSGAVGGTTPIAGVDFVGVGVSGRSGASPTETMCVRADSSGRAKTIAAAVQKGLARTSHVLGRPWTSLLSGAKVTVEGRTVKLVATPAGVQPAGLLLRSFQQADLPGVYS